MKTTLLCWLCAACACMVTTASFAQSDPSNFATVIVLPDDQTSISGSIGSDTQLNVAAGGTVASSFNVGPSNGSGFNIEMNLVGGSVGSQVTSYAGSTVNVLSGFIGNGFDAFSGVVNMSGGTFGDDFDISASSVLNLSGGDIGVNFDALSGSTVNMTGGSIGDSIDVFASTFNLHGGEIGEEFDVNNGALVNIFGGDVGDQFDVFSGGEVHIFATQASIDGIALSLNVGESIVVTQRGGALLESTLEDGAFLDFQLNDSFSGTLDSFGPGSTVRVTLVPEPSTASIFALVALLVARHRRRAE